MLVAVTGYGLLIVKVLAHNQPARCADVCMYSACYEPTIFGQSLVVPFTNSPVCDTVNTQSLREEVRGGPVVPSPFVPCEDSRRPAR